jgi:hypothetical protein
MRSPSRLKIWRKRSAQIDQLRQKRMRIAGPKACVTLSNAAGTSPPVIGDLRSLIRFVAVCPVAGGWRHKPPSVTFSQKSHFCDREISTLADWSGSCPMVSRRTLSPEKGAKPPLSDDASFTEGIVTRVGRVHFGPAENHVVQKGAHPTKEKTARRRL